MFRGPTVSQSSIHTSLTFHLRVNVLVRYLQLNLSLCKTMFTYLITKLSGYCEKYSSRSKLGYLVESRVLLIL